MKEYGKINLWDSYVYLLSLNAYNNVYCPGVYSVYPDGLAGTGLNGMRPLVAGSGGLVDPRAQAALAAGLPPTGKP
jgi:hypothetical protein